MCSRVTCHVCKKATWSGCGQHIEEALSGVPEADRCKCQPFTFHFKGLLIQCSMGNIGEDVKWRAY